MIDKINKLFDGFLKREFTTFKKDDRQLRRINKRVLWRGNIEFLRSRCIEIIKKRGTVMSEEGLCSKCGQEFNVSGQYWFKVEELRKEIEGKDNPYPDDIFIGEGYDKVRHAWNIALKIVLEDIDSIFSKEASDD